MPLLFCCAFDALGSPWGRTLGSAGLCRRGRWLTPRLQPELSEEPVGGALPALPRRPNASGKHEFSIVEDGTPHRGVADAGIVLLEVPDQAADVLRKLPAAIDSNRSSSVCPTTDQKSGAIDDIDWRTSAMSLVLSGFASTNCAAIRFIAG